MNVPINIKSKFEQFSDHWSPKIIAEMNNYHFKLVRIQGEFIWHKHDTTDEVFIVVEGSMYIEYRDNTIKLREGEMAVVPKGKYHKPYAQNECKVLLIEPKGVINTGNVIDKMTADNNVWI